MKTLRGFRLVLIVLITSVFVGCSTNSEWHRTSEGTYIYCIADDSYKMIWEGETFENLIHGQGVLKVLKGDSLTDKIIANAYYGAISAQDVISVNDTTKYVGNTKWNKQDGFGVLVQPHNIYVGDFVKSNPHGNLSWYQNGKLRYKGEWREGHREGIGVSYDRDGIYTGTFSNNLYDGEGEKFYKNGLSYDGEWSEGLRNGYGNLYADNFFYSGNFSQSLPNGEGYLVIGDGIFTYNGNWVNGEMSQYGECIYSNGDSYEGEWKNSLFNGFGVCKYTTGDVYEGDWKDGLQEGKGRYVSKNFTYVGDWEGGWINGEGQINYANGDWYEGDFYQNERFGVGCYHFNNGNYYEGEFVNDTINGLGVFHFEDGSRYEGEFEDGKMFGDGTLYINVNGEEIAITAFWDGTHNLPTEASVLFENGDLYEGELVNGFPTANGIWTTQKERDEGKSFANKANDFYKEHRDTWNKAVIITSTVLTAVEVSAPFVGAAIGSIIPGAGTAAGAAVGTTVSKIAKVANVALNVVDASVAIASATYDVKEAYENREDPTEAYKTLAVEVGANVGLLLLPKALKAIPAGKIMGKLSASAAGKAAAKMAQKAGKQISKGASKIAATSAAKAASSITKALKNKTKKGFQKLVQIGKDSSGKLEMRFLTSKTGIKTNKIYISIGKRIKNINKEVAKAKEKELEKKLAKKAAKKSSAIGKNVSKTISKDVNHYLNSTSEQERGELLYKIKYQLDKSSPEQKRLLMEKMPKELRTKVEKVRIQLPKNNGHWTGERGNSMWVPDDNYCPPNKNYGNVDNKTWAQIKKENNINGIVYKNGVPDMSGVSIAKLSIDWKKELGPDFENIMLSPEKNRKKLQEKAFNIYAEKHNISASEAKVLKGDAEPVEQLMKMWNCSEQEVWNRCGNPNRRTYVWHESPDCKTLELIPTEIHHNVTHTGGISLIKNELQQ